MLADFAAFFRICTFHSAHLLAARRGIFSIFIEKPTTNIAHSTTGSYIFTLYLKFWNSIYFCSWLIRKNTFLHIIYYYLFFTFQKNLQIIFYEYILTMNWEKKICRDSVLREISLTKLIIARSSIWTNIGKSRCEYTLTVTRICAFGTVNLLTSGRPDIDSSRHVSRKNHDKSHLSSISARFP